MSILRTTVFDGPENRDNRILELRRWGFSVADALYLENHFYPPKRPGLLRRIIARLFP